VVTSKTYYCPTLPRFIELGIYLRHSASRMWEQRPFAGRILIDNLKLMDGRAIFTQI
jgi:hypothetical protein